MKILFATHNQHKANELKALLPTNLELITLNDINLKEEIPETADTIEGNAILKVNYIVNHFELNCFADDTGLEVDALNGAPGVHSARYAGESRNDEDNIQLLLEKLGSNANRTARFKTIIAMHLKGRLHLFEGIAEGKITHEKKGEMGFGYDPIFIPEGSTKTFAEMDMMEKNSMSHRGKAFKKLIEFLNQELLIL